VACLNNTKPKPNQKEIPMLPKIKSDLDHLERLAADFHSDGHAQTAIDLRRAIMDIQNLRDELHNLNNKIWKASRDLNDFSLELAK